MRMLLNGYSVEENKTTLEPHSFLVCLSYKITFIKQMSGQDKPSASLSMATPPTVGSSLKQRLHHGQYNDALPYSQPARTVSSCRVSERKLNPEGNAWFLML